MSLARKLNLKPGTRARVIGRPRGVDLDDVETTSSPAAPALLLFVRTAAELDAKGEQLVAAARADRIAWVAYPKAGQLETDLNRDLLAARLRGGEGIQPVRQIAVNEVWSALRFRPAR